MENNKIYALDWLRDLSSFVDYTPVWSYDRELAVYGRSYSKMLE
ncbi:hypothetical protein [Solitalea lacus]|nr:hypothetical protein [Solitalea lacus]